MGGHGDQSIRSTPVFLGPKDRLVVFDGVCKFCHFWSRFIIRVDSNLRIKLATVQSPVGTALFEHYDLPSSEIESVYYFADGQVFEKSTALLKIAKQLPWPWWPLLICSVIPRPIRDRLYDLIARNRYCLFGRYELCPAPTAEQRARYFVLK